MKKILYIPLLLIIVSCGGKGVEGNVGQIISIAAEEILEETNVDYNWIIMGQPDGSLLSPKDLKYKNNGQEMMFSPDYPGDYTFEVSITKFGDELSNQSFFFTISDIEDEDIEDIEDLLIYLLKASTTSGRVAALALEILVRKGSTRGRRQAIEYLQAHRWDDSGWPSEIR